MFATIKRYSRHEEGVTLIEVLVVIAIMATLSLVTIGIITSLFDSSIRTSKYLEQNTTIETMYGFMASRLSLTNVGDIGTTTGSGASEKINPTSIAGDQFVFTSSSGSGSGNQLCYRMFYLKNANPAKGFAVANSVWVATDSDCANIAPTRGPNQAGGPTNDPVLDNGAGNPFVIANKVVPSNNEFSIVGTTGPNICNGSDTAKAFNRNLIPFYFCNNSLSTTYNGGSPDAAANSGSASAFYNDLGNRDSIQGVQSVSYIDAGVAPTIPVRSYSQLFSLGQVQTNSCALDTAGQNIVVDLPAPEPWNEVGPSSVPFQNNWSNYPGWATAAYYKDDTTDRVFLKGLVRSGNANSVIFTLPAGYRPTENHLFWQHSAGSASGGVRIDVNPSGNVLYQGSANPSYVSLEGMGFRVAAP